MRIYSLYRPLRMRDAQFSSKAYGTHEYKEVTCEGRTQFDLMLAIQRDHKLSSYSLNAVGSLTSSCIPCGASHGALKLPDAVAEATAPQRQCSSASD